MLNSHDITALIRDTEAHERALFTLAPPDDLFPAREPKDGSNRRSTMFSIERDVPPPTSIARGPRRNTAVAAFLGGDFAERLRRERAKAAQTPRDGNKQTEDLDVDLLLQGAERLCAA